MPSAMAAIAPAECRTPLGMPVLPEVYCTSASLPALHAACGPAASGWYAGPAEAGARPARTSAPVKRVVVVNSASRASWRAGVASRCTIAAAQSAAM